MRTRCFLLILCILSAEVCSEKHTLHVGALFELSNHWYAEYINFFVTILEHVFEEVENRTDILADYSLKLITKDTQVILLLLLLLLLSIVIFLIIIFRLLFYHPVLVI